MIKIKFHGAAGQVTGSCYEVSTEKSKMLIDCGMFQGKLEEHQNYENFKFNPRKIDFVVLTHSHLDHCGLLPKLVKNGFKGKIFTSLPTSRLLPLMLYDSAKVQDIRRREFKGFNVKVKGPIYDEIDVEQTIKLVEAVDYEEQIKVNDSFSFSLKRVGHVLGAASIELQVIDKNIKKKIIFSGDIGNSSLAIDNRFSESYEGDIVVMESLYGDELHPTRKKTEELFLESIKRTLQRGGNVIVPTFALQRSQEIMNLLKKFIMEGKLPTSIRIYLDGPLSIEISSVYKEFYSSKNKETSLFDIENIRFVQKDAVSKKLSKKRGSILIAGHGMCEGGRVVNHLINNIDDPRCTINFVGFLADFTLGKEILESKGKKVVIDGISKRVNAEVNYFTGFSAHADVRGYMSWLSKLKKNPKTVILTHAEREKSEALKSYLSKRNYSDIRIPSSFEEIEI